MKLFQTMLLFAAIALTACSPKDTRPVGNWKISSFKTNAPGIPEYMLEQAEKEALSTSYNLKADSTVEIKSNFLNQGAKGTWAYIDSSQTIEVTFTMNDKTTTEKYKVTAQDDTSMTWFMLIPDVGDMTLGLSKQPETEEAK